MTPGLDILCLCVCVCVCVCVCAALDEGDIQILKTYVSDKTLCCVCIYLCACLSVYVIDAHEVCASVG